MIFNIFGNFLKKKNYLIIFKKFLRRFEKNDSSLAIKWAQDQAKQTIDIWMQNTDYKLYLETKKECKVIKSEAENILAKSSFWQILQKEKNAGSAAYELLYFLTKKKNPNVIVETGVAAGWSSLTFLRASKNKKIKIFSSDFPYFRKKNPEKYIGILAKNESNYKDLQLFIEGDEINIPLIAKKLENDKIDLFHYDSDKSYSGRDFCLKTLSQNFSSNAILVFDDIHNNFHFRDFVFKNNLKFTVLKHPNYVGIVHLGS
jgi:predicted O-methyltransferase YrrM